MKVLGVKIERKYLFKKDKKEGTNIFCVFACMKYKNLMIREEFPANAHPFERENTKDRTEKSYNDVELLKAF